MHQNNDKSSNEKIIGPAASSSTSDAQAIVQTTPAKELVSLEKDVAKSAQISTCAQVITDDEDDLQVVIPKETNPKKKPFAGPKSRKPQMERMQVEVKQTAVEKPMSPPPEANNVFPVGM